MPVEGWGPGGRPAAFLRLEGDGCIGTGESVAWTAEEQALFAERCPALVPRGRHTVRKLTDAVYSAAGAVYDRAAIEAAALDLALRQAGTNAFALAGLPARPVRYLHSFGVLPDPAAAIRRLRSAAPGACVKLDVDPEWPDDVFAELSALEGVTVLDFKGRGTPDVVERAQAWLPEALLEDPYQGTRDEALSTLAKHLPGRVTLDAPIRAAADLENLPFTPYAVNVKPARMGSFLEALRTIAACGELRIATYVGGMFEVGPGRAQSQVLASLFSAEAWNDVAPLAVAPGEPPSSSPLEIPFPFTGLGFPPAQTRASS